MSRIYITGDKGFFGSRFHAVYDHVHEVRGVDIGEVDITSKQAVESSIREFEPEIVIHAAAVTSTQFADQNPEATRRINVDGAAHVAEAAADVGARMILFSTEQVFNGNPEPGPYSEQSVPAPDTMYGVTKLEAEKKVAEVTDKLWILRFTWLFGLPERNMTVNPNILWNTVRLALAGRQANVATREYRGHTYGYDMIESILKVLDIEPGTYHIGSRNDLDRFDLTCFILTELGLGSRIGDLVQPDTQKYSEKPRDLRLDTSLLADAGIRFEQTQDALVRTLTEFGLRGALG